MVIQATLKWRCDDKRWFLATKVVVQPTKWWSSPATADPLSAKKGGLSQQNNAGWWYTYPSEKYDFVSWDD
jgi:hypothetical protein